MSRLTTLSAVLLAMLPLAGCFSGSSGGDDFDFVPGQGFEPTGRTIRLKATVIDVDQELFSGLDTWLWAFCFAPVDPTDEISKGAIQTYTPLPGDIPLNPPEGYSCSVPGPTLRVRQGDRVVVEFSHSHFHPHTIHWHGQLVPWESDGAPGVTQDSVESGGAFTYDFIAAKAGTLWYHCHVDTQLHVQQGLYGMIIVEPQDDKYEPKDVDSEHTLIFSTMNRNTVEAVGTSRHSHPPGCASGFPSFNNVPCENPPSLAGKPDIFLVNGHSYPYTMDQKETLIVVQEGERIRLRLLNAGETTEVIHPHGHDMLVTHRDGSPLEAPYYVDTLLIGPAERYDVIMDMNNPGPWMIHTHVNSHETNCGKAPGGMHTMLVYEEYADKMHEFKAEAAAQCAFGSQLSLPGDFVNGTTFALRPTGPAPPLPGTPVADGPVETMTWSFPIELPCAVQKVTFRAFLDSDSPLASQGELTVQVKDSAGAPPDGGSKVLGAEPDFLFIIEKEGLSKMPAAPGAYTVEASGSSTPGALELDVVVDYYENFEESKIGHLNYKTSGCLGFT